MIPSQPPSHKPTLEEVIRIKRAERPPAEFWKRFEEELRAKQLAAIVAPRPWWQSLTGLVPGRRAALAGFGAAAAVAAVAYLRIPSNQASAVAQASTRAQQVASIQKALEPVNAGPVIAAAPAALPAVTPEVIQVAENAVKPDEQHREATGTSIVVNPVLIAARFSAVLPPPPHSAMELTLPATTLTFAPNVLTDAGSSEPLAAIPTPREQTVARFASFAEVAMLGFPAVSPERSRLTPRDSDLRDRGVGLLSAKGNALLLRY